MKVDKERRGVGMQNFRYLPSLKDLGYTIRMTSPSAYEILRKVIPMEHPRTIRLVELLMKRLTLTFDLSTVRLKANERSFQLNHVNVHIHWSVIIWSRSTMLDQLGSAVMIQNYLPPSDHTGMPKKRRTMLLDALAHHCGLRISKNLSINSKKDTWRKRPRSGSIFTHHWLTPVSL